MDSVLTSEDSCDLEVKNLKNQLTEYGLDEDNLTKEEMVDLLKALNYSKTTVEEEKVVQTPQKAEVEANDPPNIMKRNYLNVRDRRMPWSLIPNNLAPAEKARTLAVYIKLMSINNYRQARQSVNMTAWAPPIQIIEATRIQPQRSTRSGRSVPVYADFDDDSSDFDCVITKIKKRKVSNSDLNEICARKSLGVKRKLKDENIRLAKEAKVFNDTQKLENDNHVSADIYSIIED